MFCPVIMVYFFHELTIQRGEGTIKEVIKCYFQSCFDSCRYLPRTLQTKCKTCFGGPRMIQYSFKKKVTDPKTQIKNLKCFLNTSLRHILPEIVKRKRSGLSSTNCSERMTRAEWKYVPNYVAFEMLQKSFSLSHIQFWPFTFSYENVINLPFKIRR